MKEESDSTQAVPTADHESTAVYDALEHSLLAHEYENAFLTATGLSLQLVASDASTMLFGRTGNAFCRLMAQSAGSCLACQQIHEELQRKVAASLAPQMIDCFAGLIEFAVPIVVNG